MADNESIKEASDYLRGTLLEGLADASTGALSKDDAQLTKFHGIYQQDDRDIRKERKKKKLEPAYSFMIRVRVPGGVSTPKQWLEMDRLANTYANGTLKLTTRQAFQFHGVIKSNLRQTVAEINEALLDTLAACGDVNRNVMCNPNPNASEVHGDVQKLAHAISDHLSPRTGAYHEIWIADSGGEKVKVTREPPLLEATGTEEEPIYGKYYLPRKFKIVIAVPPSNDVDIFAHDLGYIAIVKDKKIIGYNVTAGGGMGMTHGNEKTFPRLANVIGFCKPDQAVAVAEAVVVVQRNFGNRKDRRNARLKYTIERIGLEKFRKEVEKLLGFSLLKPKPFQFDGNGDRYGWTEDHKGKWHYTMFISNGRVLDTEDYSLLTGLREIAQLHKGDFRLTPNQNLQIGNVSKTAKPKIEKLLKKFRIIESTETSALRLHSMACVALPTCGLALAESERYLPDLISQLEEVLENYGLTRDAITIRMTGCPNGCSRPYIAEIGLVGRSPGTYNIYLGAGFCGDRLNKLYKPSVKSDQICATLEPIIEDYAKNRKKNEHFGDFVIRQGYVQPALEGRDFHKDFAPGDTQKLAGSVER